MSRVGQAGLAGSSTPQAAQRLACTASARPAASTARGESYNGHWARGRGPGGRPGGRGAAGSPEPSLFARFPSTMAARLFPLSSSSSSALPAAASRCLCLQAARPPSLGHRAPLLGRRETQGPALTLTHTGTLRHTQRSLARPLLPFSLSLPAPSLPPSPPRSLSEPLSEGGPRAGGGWSCPAGPAPSPRARRKSGGREEGLLRKTKEIETRRLGTERIGPGETWTGRRPREAGRETHPPEPHAEVKGGAGLCRLLVSSPSQPTPTPLRLKAGLRSHSELLWRNPRAARWEELWGAGLLYTDPHSEFSLKILEKGGQSRLPRPKPSRVPSPGSEIPFTEHPSGTPPLKPRGC